VNPRAGLDDVEKRKVLTLPGLELRPLGRPARSQSHFTFAFRDFVSRSVNEEDCKNTATNGARANTWCNTSTPSRSLITADAF
jgi:hypothetical protein